MTLFDQIRHAPVPQAKLQSAGLAVSRRQLPARPFPPSHIELPSTGHIGEMRALLLAQEWRPVVSQLPLSAAQIKEIARRAIVNDTCFVREALASGQVDEHALYRAIARELRLGYLEEIAAEQINMPAPRRLSALGRHSGPSVTLVTERSGNVVHVLARNDIDLAVMRAQLRQRPGLAGRLRIAAPSVLRAALLERSQERLLFNAQNEHSLEFPDLSARTVISGRQGLYIGLFLALFPVSFALMPVETMATVHFLAAMMFLACIALRLVASRHAHPPVEKGLQNADPMELPVYSVIVALYKEREVIPQLLVALGELQWPRSKLEIKLVCEADDRETLEALRAHRLRPYIEVVEVPPGAPRTKPKALAYALPLCSGEFVTLYDAEDRPHPLQLLAAWTRFRRSDDRLACLQAPLEITNASASLLSRMFAFEYAGLFRGLLPFLARARLLLPLGGTSNHFRRSALVEVGGWDPYNVTEDADLGLRLARFGYRAGVIHPPTLEDGPETMREWLPQRIRWFKGWMQTFLVHMRRPVLVWREIGTASFLTMQVLFAGMILSALLHPVFFVSLLYVAVQLVQTGEVNSFETLMAATGLLAVACGYGAFVLLGWRTLTMAEKPSLVRIALLTPLHWFLLSAAAWIALAELYWRPHHWHKTPHRRSRRPELKIRVPQAATAATTMRDRQ